jgi:hypothetical protein
MTTFGDSALSTQAHSKKALSGEVGFSGSSAGNDFVQGISLSGACEMDKQLGIGLYVAAMVAVSRDARANAPAVA